MKRREHDNLILLASYEQVRNDVSARIEFYSTKQADYFIRIKVYNTLSVEQIAEHILPCNAVMFQSYLDSLGLWTQGMSSNKANMLEVYRTDDTNLKLFYTASKVDINRNTTCLYKNKSIKEA